MFEHRLGLALGKSVGEIRQLPYPEFRRWQLMYMLEPWGWQDAEYRTAAILAKLHNANIAKRSDAKAPAFFMRDMEKEILKELRRQAAERQAADLGQMDTEARDALIRKSMREFFGV